MIPKNGYTYAVSRLKAMANRLLDNNSIIRLWESETFSSAMKLLSETHYAQWLSEMKNENDFESLISSELNYVVSETRSISPDKRIPILFQLPFDFHNIKVLVKDKITRTGNQGRRIDLLTSLGNVSVEDLILAVESEDYRLLPFGLHAVLPESLSIWEQSHDVLMVEKRLDAALFELMKSIAERIEIEGVKKWVRAKIDAENIRNVLRLVRFGLEIGKIPSFLHEGGFISKEKLLLLVNEPLEGWGRLVGFADAAMALSGITDFSDTEKSLTELEKALDDYVTGVLGPYRYDAFAPENILAFLWAKDIEAKNLRIILVGKANDVDKDVIRGLLRNVL